jgi:hypothetical protein
MTTQALERAARAVQDATAGELSDGQNVRIARAVLMAVRDWSLEHWKDDDQIHNQNYMLDVADCMNRICNMEDVL